MTGRLHHFRKWVLAYVFVNCIFFIVNLCNGLYHGLEPRFDLGFWPMITPLFNVYFCSWIFSIVLGLWILLRGYFSAKKEQRKKIGLILFGCGVGYLGAAANWPMWYGIHVVPYSTIALSLLSGTAFLAYAIFHYRLFSVILGARYVFVYLIINLFIGMPAGFFVWEETKNFPAVIVTFIVPILGYLVILFLRTRVEGFVDSLKLFSRFGERKRVLVQYEERIWNSRTIRECAEIAIECFAECFDVTNATMLVWSDQEKEFHAQAQRRKENPRISSPYPE
jgi:hypothetical protein